MVVSLLRVTALTFAFMAMAGAKPHILLFVSVLSQCRFRPLHVHTSPRTRPASSHAHDVCPRVAFNANAILVLFIDWLGMSFFRARACILLDVEVNALRAGAEFEFLPWQARAQMHGRGGAENS